MRLMRGKFSVGRHQILLHKMQDDLDSSKGNAHVN